MLLRILLCHILDTAKTVDSVLCFSLCQMSIIRENNIKKFSIQGSHSQNLPCLILRDWYCKLILFFSLHQLSIGKERKYHEKHIIFKKCTHKLCLALYYILDNVNATISLLHFPYIKYQKARKVIIVKTYYTQDIDS